jgi:hypothetical protein
MHVSARKQTVGIPPDPVVSLRFKSLEADLPRVGKGSILLKNTEAVRQASLSTGRRRMAISDQRCDATKVAYLKRSGSKIFSRNRGARFCFGPFPSFSTKSFVSGRDRRSDFDDQR